MRSQCQKWPYPLGGLIVSRYSETIGIAILQGVRQMCPFASEASEAMPAGSL